MWKIHRNKLTEKELSCAVPKIRIITLMGIKDVFDAVEGFSLGIDGASLNFGGLRSDSIRPEDVVAPVISEMLQLVTRNYFVVRVRTLRHDRVDCVVDCARSRQVQKHAQTLSSERKHSSPCIFFFSLLALEI